jgi:hypothetical protein
VEEPGEQGIGSVCIPLKENLTCREGDMMLKEHFIEDSLMSETFHET